MVGVVGNICKLAFRIICMLFLDYYLTLIWSDLFVRIRATTPVYPYLAST